MPPTNNVTQSPWTSSPSFPTPSLLNSFEKTVANGECGPRLKTAGLGTEETN